MFKKYVLGFVSILMLLCTVSGCGIKLPINTTRYITERYVQYNEKDELYEVMFALTDEQNRYLDASGTAVIKITDVNDNILYEN